MFVFRPNRPELSGLKSINQIFPEDNGMRERKICRMSHLELESRPDADRSDRRGCGIVAKHLRCQDHLDSADARKSICFLEDQPRKSTRMSSHTYHVVCTVEHSAVH